MGQVVFHLSRDVLQSFIYLKLSVAGQLTVFVARTKGHFWSVRPARQLLAAVIGTQSIAVLITVYGILLPAMGWGYALFIVGYAFAAFIITDFLKIPVYRLLDHSGVTFMWKTKAFPAPYSGRFAITLSENRSRVGGPS
jgi:H+-transporting ATPase